MLGGCVREDERIIVNGGRERTRWRRSGRRWCSEREDGFVEHHVARRDDATGVVIKAPITTMISGVTQEDTSTGSGAEFVSGGGCLVGEAQAAKHPEVSVVQWSTQEPLEWRHQCQAWHGRRLRR